MGLTLVPIDFGWLSDAKLRQSLMSRIRERIESSVQELSMSRMFQKTAQNVQVTESGDSVIVDFSGKSTPSRPAAPAVRESLFPKPVSLARLLGKHPAGRADAGVKDAIDKAMSTSAEAMMAAKEDLQAEAPARVRDILGII